MTNSDKLMFVGVLLIVELAIASVAHFCSGNSLWRVRQDHRPKQIFVEVTALSALLLFLAVVLPSFGRTGPPWRRPPFHVEFALILPLITGVALCFALVVSIVRRLVARQLTKASPNQRLQLTGDARDGE